MEEKRIKKSWWNQQKERKQQKETEAKKKHGIINGKQKTAEINEQ